jgi:hypothetical protein
MTGQRRIPRWAQRERLDDLVWIMREWSILFPAAVEQHQLRGRGCIVVNTTHRPTGAGHPFTYLTLPEVHQQRDADLLRMVSEYDPAREIVIKLIKSWGRESLYRLHPPEPSAAGAVTERLS